MANPNYSLNEQGLLVVTQEQAPIVQQFSEIQISERLSQLGQDIINATNEKLYWQELSDAYTDLTTP